MTIAILTCDGSTRLPRPWNRACSTEELLELIAGLDRWHARALPPRPRVQIDLDRVDTDEPVAVIETPTGRIDFYAFTER